MKQKKRGLRYFCYFVLIVLAIYGIGRLYYKLTDDFRIANITYDVPYNPKWETPQSASEIEQLNSLFQQPYYYIEKGAQCYAFSNEAGTHIIKFFKFKHHKQDRIANVRNWLPLSKSYRKNRLEIHQNKLNGTYNGYKLAFDVLKDECGIVALHLNRTNNINRTLKVTDKIGFHREIDLDPVVFIVQEKAQVTSSVIKDAIAKGDLLLAKERLRKLLELYMMEYQKGIYDIDHCVMQNTGFIGDRPIHFDVGKLTQDERMKQQDFQKEDLKNKIQEIRQWLDSECPKQSQEFKRDLEAFIVKKF